MRVLVQEVLKAKVSIEGKEFSSIARGLLLFVSFTEGDDGFIVGKMAEKVTKLRIFPDENGKTNLSLKDVGGEILSVSQFTLYASLKEGNRPSFVNCLRGEAAISLYEKFNKELENLGNVVKTGVFGADMK
nr:D-tyrosyl-tRNA(Tyr) deacylase [Bacilli bacterium]